MYQLLISLASINNQSIIDNSVGKMAFGFVILSVALIASCNADVVKSIVQGNDEFTVKTYKEFAKTSTNDNFVLSGLSAEIILSLLANGAKKNTLAQLLKGLSLPQNLETTQIGYKELISTLNINTDILKLLSANKIYPAENLSVSKSFKDTAVNIFESDVQNLNYENAQAAANTINQWVEEKTNNKIKNLIDPSLLLNDTAMVLVNALYFSGRWIEPFDYVEKGAFHISDTQSKELDFMHTQTSAKFSHDESLKAKFLELDFKGGNVSMTFVLPDSQTGLAAIEENLQEYLKPRELEEAIIGITLPKFIIDTKIDFKPILKSFGITDIFSDYADLSGVSVEPNLKVDFVLQKAFIDCNENGVEAAAATAVDVVQFSGILANKYTFNADHPFLFYIREKYYGTTLFTGRFRN